MNQNAITIQPGPRRGTVSVPLSKSHLHRLLIADFLAGGTRYKTSFAESSEDVLATQRCLAALANSNQEEPILDCGESGSTLRFLLPVAMTQRERVCFTASGRLPQRPIQPFLDLLAAHGVQSNSTFPLHLSGRLQPGEYAMRGDISSQIFTGLLFALPLIGTRASCPCKITFTTALESRGYVDMTLDVLRTYGITILEKENHFEISAGQQYRSPKTCIPERDWSGAAFWLAMNALGSDIHVPGLNPQSAQPDRAIDTLLQKMGGTIDVSQCPDIFPVLAVVAAATPGKTHFVGVRRLRLKESDRLAAMAGALTQFGKQVSVAENEFTVFGDNHPFRGNCTISPRNDHRIAMATAVAATFATSPITILTPECVAKSYPDFFQELLALDF